MNKAFRYICGTLIVVALIGFAAIAIPIQDRVGWWRNFPQLDHRLLPHVSAVFAAAFGAFFGSLSAFYLGRLQQRADRLEKRHAALIAAQYALASQWNMVEGIRVQHLEKVRAESNRFSKLPLFHAPVSAELIPFGELTFMLELQNPDVVQEIHIAQQSYQACATALRLRNTELERFYQNPRVEHRVLDFNTGAGVTRTTPEDSILLKQATDSLYNAADTALPKLAAAIERLHDVIKAIFPRMKALRVTPIAPKAPSSKGTGSNLNL